MAGQADLPEIEAFIDERYLDGFPHAVDPDGSLWQLFSVRTQPAFIFVDDGGSLALHYGSMGAADLALIVEQLQLQ